MDLPGRVFGEKLSACASPYWDRGVRATARCSKPSGRVFWWTRVSAKKKRCGDWPKSAAKSTVSTALSSPTNTAIISDRSRKCWASGAATVYLTEATHTEVLRILPETSHKRLDRVEHIRAGQRFIVGDIEVSPISIPHDAVDPLGFTFRANGTKVAIVTDLGYLPELVKVHLRDSDCLMLESNHDLDMLKVGPYPWHIKQRVMSRTGHLSNHTVSEFFSDDGGVRRARALRGSRASFR